MKAGRRWLAPLLMTLFAVAAPPAVAAGELDQLELQALNRYLDQLASGGAADAKLVDSLADIGWNGIETALRRYADAPDDLPPHAHRAWQALLERITRSALQPWVLIESYSPEFARFLTPPRDVEQDASALQNKLFQRIVRSTPDRRAWDLAVRITPGPALTWLASHESSSPQSPLGELRGSSELYDAWNRRLARSRYSIPVADLSQRLERLAALPASTNSPQRFESELEFIARWPKLQDAAKTRIDAALLGTARDLRLAALRVQAKVPLQLDQVEQLIEKFVTDRECVELALAAVAADNQQDHSAALRRLWPKLPGAPSKARYFALLAMAVHPAGNQTLALDALRQQPFEFLDPALSVLQHGDEQPAQAAIEFLLAQSERGHEEALRLAIARKLSGFEKAATRIALDETREVIVRQTALRYLSAAAGDVRRPLAKLLGHRNSDLRLAAIQLFASPEKLTAADREEIGPSLIQVAHSDRSEGHRQEAIFTLGQWRETQAAPFFRELLAQHPPLILADEPFNNDQYWRYRFRLMALVGLARFVDLPAQAGAANVPGADAALAELAALHDRGGPTEKMDVLLAWRSLGRCPDAALANLESAEPKLVATAARLILDHGSATQRSRLALITRLHPLWREFQNSGIDDHNLLNMLGELRREAR